MQRHLHVGVFPTAPYPSNNHCITPQPEADQLYCDYWSATTRDRSNKTMDTLGNPGGFVVINNE